MNANSSQYHRCVSIVLCGQAGMGIQTVEQLLTRILKIAGFNVFATKEYMSRVRGGMNSIEIRVSSHPVCAFVDHIDFLVALDKASVAHLAKRISSDTIVLTDPVNVSQDAESGINYVAVPFAKTAIDIGNKVYSNIVAVGVLAALFDANLQTVTDHIAKFFSAKSGKIVQGNITAAQTGYQIGKDLADSHDISLNISADPDVSEQIFLSGTDAIALGAIAGGCDFLASYPMSPSTGVLVFLAKRAEEFGIIVEQAEDEIAAINMAIGAWYAGGRAMVTTSGGGFALMTEGLSLAAILESPVVIHLAQRPGPATGLPTRTEQGDLEMALYSGHGEFPRVILAPGTLEEAFHLTMNAFNIADKFQVPVIILTDQYLVDTYYNTEPMDLSSVKVQKHVVTTSKGYRRYEITDNGISPRGIPGLGEGLVCVDSDEHDPSGHITEDMDVRVMMVDKRLKKLELLKQQAVSPCLWPEIEYKNLIVCWGSSLNIVKEALASLKRNDTAVLHFTQVHPLHAETTEYLKKADKTIIVESNATSQFSKLIKLETGIDIDQKILKYSGLSFTVEEVAENLRNILS